MESINTIYPVPSILIGKAKIKPLVVASFNLSYFGFDFGPSIEYRQQYRIFILPYLTHYTSFFHIFFLDVKLCNLFLHSTREFSISLRISVRLLSVTPNVWIKHALFYPIQRDLAKKRSNHVPATCTLFLLCISSILFAGDDMMTPIHPSSSINIIIIFWELL